MDDELDPEAELQRMIDEEKEKRVASLPKLRPADQIDITDQQLLLLRRIYNEQPNIGAGVQTVTFFVSLRKHPEIKKINTTLARDPDGCSRIPAETFQQVFDRMERDFSAKTIEWPVIIEFFTKRGRPLSKEEIQKLRAEDQKLREEEDAKKRKEEELEKRRLNAMTEQLAEEEDFETYQRRMENEQKEQKKRQRDEELSGSEGSEDRWGRTRDVDDLISYDSEDAAGSDDSDHRFTRAIEDEDDMGDGLTELRKTRS